MRFKEREEFQLFLSVDCWHFHVSRPAAGGWETGRRIPRAQLLPAPNGRMLWREAV